MENNENNGTLPEQSSINGLAMLYITYKIGKYFISADQYISELKAFCQVTRPEPLLSVYWCKCL